MVNNGSDNLDIMEHAPRYMRHVASLIRSHLPEDGQVVDFGAGDGKQSLLIRQPSESIVCIESDERRIADLRLMGYLTAKSLVELETGSVDVVYSSNCLEHVEDDFTVFTEISRILTNSGIVIIYVPAFPFLFSEMDRSVGHVRRYTRHRLQELAEVCGFRITTIRYVDSLGVIATMLFKLSKKPSGKPSKSSVYFYDTVVFGLSRLLDTVVHRFFGKNLLMVATKS